MNPNLILLVVLASIVVGLFALGWMSCDWVRRRKALYSPLSVDGLAERSDVNGTQLVKLARRMRAMAAEEQREIHKAQLLDWARALERAAVEHLECINAISLDALQSVGDRVPVHLGDFGARGGDRRAPGYAQFPTVLLRGGAGHGR